VAGTPAAPTSPSKEGPAVPETTSASSSEWMPPAQAGWPPAPPSTPFTQALDHPGAPAGPWAPAQPAEPFSPSWAPAPPAGSAPADPWTPPHIPDPFVPPAPGGWGGLADPGAGRAARNERSRTKLVVILSVVGAIVLIAALGGGAWLIAGRGDDPAPRPAAYGPATGGPATGASGTGGSGTAGSGTASEKPAFADDPDRVRVNGDGYTYSADEDWTKIDPEDLEIEGADADPDSVLAKLDGDEVSTMATFVAPMDGASPSVEAAALVTEVKLQADGATMNGEPVELTLGGEEALRLDFTMTMQGRKLAGQRILAFHDDKLYTFDFQSTKGAFAESSRQWLQAAQTWEWD
jgi:hypothetical protein